MDAVPTEIILRILHFLPGKDVARSLQLNRTFRELIKNNRKYVKFPTVFLNISTAENDTNSKKYKSAKMKITLNRETECVIDCSDWDSILFVDRGDSSTEKFLQPFLPKPRSMLNSFNRFRRKKKKHSLQSLFDFICERTDVNLVVDEIFCPEWTNFITEVVKNKRNKIVFIEVRLPFHLTKTYLHRILPIGRNSYFEMARAFAFILPYESEARNLSEIASFFRCVALFVPHPIANATINLIIKEWREWNYPNLEYVLRINWTNPEEFDMKLEENAYIQQHFHIDVKNLKTPKKNELAFMSLKDKKSENVMKLGKILVFDGVNDLGKKLKMYRVSINTLSQ